MHQRSPLEELAALPEEDQAAAINALTAEQAEAARWDWQLRARPNQLPPAGDWRGWLIQAGRGFGKTRTAAEFVRSQVEHVGHIIIAGPTAGDIRDTMVETGPSSLMRIFPPWQKPDYQPSKSKIVFHTGAVAQLIPGSEPERFRGPQGELLWADELAAWGPSMEAAWDLAMLGLRLGNNPRWIVTTTPKPLPLLKKLRHLAGVRVTRGSTYENRSNLAESFYSEIITSYEGTRLGSQELLGELLEDVPGALWQAATIERNRLCTGSEPEPQYGRTAIAVDPAAKSKATSDDTGIIAVSLDRNNPRLGYVRGDRTVSKASPERWAQAVVDAYREFDASVIVAETNNGGDMVESTIKQAWPGAPVRQVHASESKQARAEPVSLLYEKDMIKHVGPAKRFMALEEELTTWDPFSPGRSPNRLDALVWGFTELMLLRPPMGLLEVMKENAEKLKAENKSVAVADSVPCVCGSRSIRRISNFDRQCGQCGRQWSIAQANKPLGGFAELRARGWTM